MGRRKKGLKIDGWLVIDKPLDISSTGVVNKVRWLLKAQKAGHAGTLDPLATGILPIGFGEATKTMPFIVDASKDYVFDVTWGSATTTDDLEGEVTDTSDHIPTNADIDAVLADFTGDIEQVPPAYSAIKVDGQRAYALARSGEDVELKARTVSIHSLKRAENPAQSDSENTTRLAVTCGKGTYVRSLARDIALKLGTFGHVSMLRRTRVGPFCEKRALTLDKFEALSHSAPAEDYMLSVVTALDDILVLAVTEMEAARLKNGQSIQRSLAEQGTVYAMLGDTPIAIAEALDNEVRPLRVFNM